MIRKHAERDRAPRWPRLVIVGAATAAIGIAAFGGVASAGTGPSSSATTTETPTTTESSTTAAPASAVALDTTAPASIEPDTTPVPVPDVTPSAPSADTTAPTASPCSAEQTLLSCPTDARITDGLSTPEASGIGEPAFFHPVQVVDPSTIPRPATAGAPTVTQPDATLPATGSSEGIQLAVALAALGAGTGLVVVARRRREASAKD